MKTVNIDIRETVRLLRQSADPVSHKAADLLEEQSRMLHYFRHISFKHVGAAFKEGAD